MELDETFETTSFLSNRFLQMAFEWAQCFQSITEYKKLTMHHLARTKDLTCTSTPMSGLGKNYFRAVKKLQSWLSFQSCCNIHIPHSNSCGLSSGSDLVVNKINED
jgi:hypothetical protein